jgi:exo-beta-1,3-glucanase (GH17 family)
LRLANLDNTKNVNAVRSIIAKACAMDLFFIGSNVEEFKSHRETQKEQYFGIGYSFMMERLKDSLDQ